MVEQNEKVEFASAAWIAVARRELEDLVGIHGQASKRFSLCEIFTDAPKHLDPSGIVAWHFYIDGTTVTVAAGEVDDATVKLSTDYQGVLPRARLFYTPEILAERAQEEPGTGFDSVEGDLTLTPDYITELHNRLAIVTA